MKTKLTIASCIMLAAAITASAFLDAEQLTVNCSTNSVATAATWPPCGLIIHVKVAVPPDFTAGTFTMVDADGTTLITTNIGAAGLLLQNISYATCGAKVTLSNCTLTNGAPESATVSLKMQK